MTPIEHRLRLRIDQLLDERSYLRGQLEAARVRARRATASAWLQRRRAEQWKHRALHNTGLRK